MGELIPIDEQAKHKLFCQRGKHEMGQLHTQFSYQNHTYIHAQCQWCYKDYYAKDGKSISMDEFYNSFDEFRKH